METSEVVIVGAGVAGLLAAYEVLRRRPGTTLTLIEAGLPLEERLRQATPTSEGYGGAGLFLGGSLYFGTTTLPVMPPVSAPPEVRPVVAGDAFERQARRVDALFTELGATAPWRPAPAEPLANAIEQARLAGIDYITNYPARRLTADERQGALRRLYTLLTEHGARQLMGAQVTQIVNAGNGYVVTFIPTSGKQDAPRETSQPQRIHTRAVLLAPGRYGAEWLTRIAGGLGARIIPLPTTYGVRMELPAMTYDPLTDVNPDPRLQMSLGDDALIKTYATCPGGVVTPVTRYGALVASGVPALKREQRGPTTTMALLIQPGAEGAAGTWHGGEESARLLNERAPGKLIVQRMEDVRQRRPTDAEALAQNSVRPSCADAIPGALYDAYPDAYWRACETFLGRINQMAPGVLSDDALVYGPAEERFNYFSTDDHMQTTTPGLFVAGDGPGQSQGIIQASIAGLLAGEGLASYLFNAR